MERNYKARNVRTGVRAGIIVASSGLVRACAPCPTWRLSAHDAQTLRVYAQEMHERGARTKSTPDGWELEEAS